MNIITVNEFTEINAIKESEWVTNEMKVELTELNKYEGKLKQPNGPKANEGAFSEINETQVKLKELKQRSMNWIQPSEFKKARRSKSFNSWNVIELTQRRVNEATEINPFHTHFMKLNEMKSEIGWLTGRNEWGSPPFVFNSLN